jgi:hypothetical protein
VTIFMPDWMSKERLGLMRSLGADINLVSSEQGGFLRSIDLAKQLAESEQGTFLPSQFSDEDNVAAHAETTGPEIWWQLRFRSLLSDAVVVTVFRDDNKNYAAPLSTATAPAGTVNRPGVARRRPSAHPSVGGPSALKQSTATFQDPSAGLSSSPSSG